MAREKQAYGIRATTYVKTPTGEVYPEDTHPAYLVGKRKYSKAEKKGEKVINSTWGDVKQAVYKASTKDKNISVRWGKPRLKSVTREYSDGRKETTYYNPVKNNANGFTYSDVREA